MLSNQYKVNPLTLLDELLNLHSEFSKLKLEARGCTSTEHRSVNTEKCLSFRQRNGKGKNGSPVLDKLDELRTKFFEKIEEICSLSSLECPPRQALVIGQLPYYTFIDSCMFLRSYLEVCFDQFRSLRKNTNLSSLLSPLKVMSTWPVHLFPKYCKYVTAYPHAYLCRDIDPTNMPPLPEGFPPGIRAALLFKGQALSFFMNRMSGRVSRKTFNFTWAIVSGVKRATATVSPFFVLDTMVKHKQALSKVPTFDEKDLDEFDEHLERMSHARVANSAYLREVSTSASYETKRSTGGAREYIRGMFKDNSNLIRMSYDPHNGVQEFRSSYDLPSFGAILDENFGHSLRTRFRPKAMVAPVLEPLKCRLITKGNSLEYWLSRGFQKDMWKYLGNFEQFTPTRRPLDLSDFYTLLRKEKNFDTQLSYWVSGDYSAATDGLNMNYSKETLEFLIRRSDFKNLNTLQQVKYRDLLRSVLGEHEVEYPITENLKNKLADILLSYLSEPAIRKLKDIFKRQNSYKSEADFDIAVESVRANPANHIYPDTLMRGFKEIWDKADLAKLEEPFHQNNGQLMGSTLSFPVLCLVNAVQYWRSFEEYLGYEVPFQELPVLINGDDILFRSNPVHYNIWKKYIRAAGFELSQGKNYLSRNFFCINTRGYFYTEKTGLISELPALNVGLLMGKSKGSSNGKFEKLTYAGIDEIYRSMLESAFDKRRATKRFLHYNRENIRKITQDGLYNLGVPRELGGVGLVLPVGISQYHTLFQKCLIRKLYRQLKRGMRSTEPQSEQPVKVVPRFSKRNLPKKLELEHQWNLTPYGPLPEHTHEYKAPKYSLDETFSVHAPELEQDRQDLSTFKIKTSFYSRKEIDAILKDTSLRSGGVKKPLEIIKSQRLVYQDHWNDML